MLAMIFYILLFVLFVRFIKVAIKAAWGIMKVLLVIVLFPVLLIVLAAAGLFAIAFPLLLIGGIISLFN